MPNNPKAACGGFPGYACHDWPHCEHELDLAVTEVEDEIRARQMLGIVMVYAVLVLFALGVWALA